MVGPGEVDDELEPEIKEECNTKYGDVQSVVIFEIPNAAPEEAVRIFTEFKRVESAIKGMYHFIRNKYINYFYLLLFLFCLQPWWTSMDAFLEVVKFEPRSMTSKNLKT